MNSHRLLIFITVLFLDIVVSIGSLPAIDFDDEDAKRYLSVRAAEELHLAVQEGLSRPLFGDMSKATTSSPPSRVHKKLFAVPDADSPIKTHVTAQDQEEQLAKLEQLKKTDSRQHAHITNVLVHKNREPSFFTRHHGPRSHTLRDEGTFTRRQAPRTHNPPPPFTAADPIQEALEGQALRIGIQTKDASHVMAQVSLSQERLQLESESGQKTKIPTSLDSLSNEDSKQGRSIAYPRTSQILKSLGISLGHILEDDRVGDHSGREKDGTLRGDVGREEATTAAALLLELEKKRHVKHPMLTESTIRMMHDASESELIPFENPQLYERHREGQAPLTIWMPDDSLPRDVLTHRPMEVWLYSLLAADYGGTSMLPHFLEHYARLGIQAERMLFIVNYNPKEEEQGSIGTRGMIDGDVSEKESPLETMLAMLDAWGADYRVWLGQYSADAHLKLKLEVLNKVPLRDWIILVDSDEFHDYEGMTALEFLEQTTNAGSNWVKGYFVDRVSTSGKLADISGNASLWSQFPLRCDIARKVAHGDPHKVAAFRGFLRSGVGNHGIIPPDVAPTYFGPAKPGEQSARYGLCGAEDLYPLTPYYKYFLFYKSENVTGNAYLWTPREASQIVKVHHFKWHAGVEQSVRDRLRHYKGEDEPCGQSAGQPRFKFWRESDRLLREIVDKGGIDVRASQLKCKRSENPFKFSLDRETAEALDRVNEVLYKTNAKR